MKLKYNINLLFLLSFLTLYSNATPLDNRSSVRSEIKSIINVFDMSLTPTPQTCTGNGQITINITNTEAGAEFEFLIYQLPNTVTPIRVTSGIIATCTERIHSPLLARNYAGYQIKESG